MALNLDSCTQIMYSFRDREDTIGRMQIHAPAIGVGLPPLTFDSIEQEAVGTFGPLVIGGLWSSIQVLSDCPIYGVGISVGYHEIDPLLRVGFGEAEVKGVFQFEDDNGEYTNITIPGLLDSVLQNNGRFIDIGPTETVYPGQIGGGIGQRTIQIVEGDGPPVSE